MSGAPDLLYVRARAALLDAAEALAEQLDAVVLVGAQAVYLHTGDADFVATAPYTTDADFCIAPKHLNDTPLLDELLRRTGSRPESIPELGSAQTGFASTSWFPKRWPDPVLGSPPRTPRQESRKASQRLGGSARRSEAHEDHITHARRRTIS